MRPRIALLLTFVALPAVAFAQGAPKPAKPAKPAETKPAGMMAPKPGAVAAVRPVYEMVKGWLLKSANQMPDSNYGFKPTPAVRSFGGIIGHVANANYMLCSTARGIDNPMKATDYEKTMDKASLVKALEESFAYCDKAYEITDAASNGQVELFGMKGSKLWLLSFNAAHEDEHYGNLVTYFRLKGMTPPSSQGSGM
jgi:uncharacterized damage-inducible protein DinB